MSDESVAPNGSVDVGAVATYFRGLQQRVCGALEHEEGSQLFEADPQPHPSGGLSYPMIAHGGQVVEKAAVNFSHSKGEALPAAATQRRPEFAGCGFEALAISLIVHPLNPYVPTTHANLRLFVVYRGTEVRDWWFGGGFDLTPYYGFKEDAIHWHQTAFDACAPFGDDIYGRCKSWCDDYFYLPHRGETRGVGGLFFDDWRRDGFSQSFAFVRSVGDHFLNGYLPIMQRRKEMGYGETQRAFQLYRRGRYVEFNLVYDRGTQYGLQSGRRTETVMASMPPVVHWRYKFTPEAGTPEAELYETFLKPQDWLNLDG
ncbi:MAG: oxygen-dependent coproporphyrinogen oxidase [Myxococcota bacterium]|nr:oxygen-dependent coproporphyrinogen oxidase [Myxococcota bacterium]